MTVSGNPGDIIPKYCTNIDLIAIKDTGNVILSLYFTEPNNNGYLIDRVLIDINHLKDLRRAINDTLKNISPNDGVTNEI